MSGRLAFRCYARIANSGTLAQGRAGSGVGEGFVESGCGSGLNFAGFQNLAAVEAFDVLRVVILGD